jgi:hypothetical protein
MFRRRNVAGAEPVHLLVSVPDQELGGGQRDTETGKDRNGSKRRSSSSVSAKEASDKERRERQ